MNCNATKTRRRKENVKTKLLQYFIIEKNKAITINLLNTDANSKENLVPLWL